MLSRARSPFPAVSATAVALALVSLVAHAHAGPWIPAPREYSAELTAFRGMADTYFDNEGARFTMPSGGVFERRSLGARVELGWKRRLAFIVAAPAVSLTHRNEDFHRTETGLGDILVGFRYALANGATALAIEADWQAPLGYLANDKNQLGAPPDSVPSLGTGRQEATGWLLFGTPTPMVSGFAQAGVGYRYRDGDLADQWAVSADVGVWAGSSVLIAGRYAGAIGVSGSLGLTDVEPLVGLFIGAIPEEQTEHVVGPEVRVRVDERLDVFFGGRFTASGKNLPHTDGYYMGFHFKQTGLDRRQGFLGGTRRP